MKFLLRASLIVIISSIFLSGCYTQLAVRGYDDRASAKAYEDETYYEDYDSTTYYDESSEYYEDPDGYYVNDYDQYWRPVNSRYYSSYYPSSVFYVGYRNYYPYWWDYYYSPYVWYPDPWYYPIAYVGWWGYSNYYPNYYYGSNYYPYNNTKYRTNTYTALRNNGRGRGSDGGRGTIIGDGARGAFTDGGRTVETGRSENRPSVITDRSQVVKEQPAVRTDPRTGRTVENPSRTVRTETGRKVDVGRQAIPQTRKKVGEVTTKDQKRYDVGTQSTRPASPVPSTRRATPRSETPSQRSYVPQQKRVPEKPKASSGRTYKSPRRDNSAASPSRSNSSSPSRSYSTPSNSSRSSSSYSRPSSSSSSRSSGTSSSSSSKSSSSSSSRGRK